MKYIVENLKEAFLADAMDAIVEEFTVQAGTGDNVASTPCLAIIAKSRRIPDLKDGEIVTITSRDTDTFQIIRTDPQTHVAGEIVMCNIFAEHLIDLDERIMLVANVLLRAQGTLSSAVITHGNANSLKVVPNSPADMRVKIKAGQGFVNYWPILLSNDVVTTAIVAPTLLRIDLIQIDSEGNYNIKTGVEHASAPVEPTVDSGYMKLASISLTNGQTEISGGITDARDTL